MRRPPVHAGRRERSRPQQSRPADHSPQIGPWEIASQPETPRGTDRYTGRASGMRFRWLAVAYIEARSLSWQAPSHLAQAPKR